MKNSPPSPLPKSWTMAQPQVRLAHPQPDIERINIDARLALLVARELLEPLVVQLTG